MWQTIMANPNVLTRLKSSKFRRSFYLNQLEKKIIRENGFIEYRKKAHHLVVPRLSKKPSNDGRQTPFKGSPIFKAMHATASCCRKCLFKWHRIPEYKTLNEREVNFVLNLITKWTLSQVNNLSV